MAKKTRNVRTATFPRMQEIRESLGWEISDIVRKLPTDSPSASTIDRLEQGIGTRVSNARRVFDVFNAAMNGKLDPGKELVIEGEKKKR
jgi:hypothetical protein